jgi:SAM-dependent methyltransferase
MVWLTQPVIVPLGGACNTRYVGVDQAPAGALPERPLEHVEVDFIEARRLGARTAVLAGGEPMMRRDLPKLLQALLTQKLVPALATNGRLLVYAKLRQLLVRAHVGYLRVELHGPAQVHDSLVGVPGAYDQTLEGLRALLIEAPPSLRIDVACTVLASNLAHLTAWVDTIATLPRRGPVTLRFVAPMAVSTSSEWPRSDQTTTHVGNALARVQQAGADLTAAWEGFAPCLLEPHAHARDELLRCGCSVLGPRETRLSFPVEPPASRVHPLPCQDCIHQPTCPGAPTILLSHEGEAALRPTRSLRANSFNFESVRDIHPFHLAPGACTARTIALRRSPPRFLFLAEDDRVTLYESPTSDFTDTEIAHVKDELEQVYVDVAEGASLTDFLTGVRRARFDPACPGCPDRPRCGGTMRVDPEPPFAREERWLAKEVSRLRGRVLDVGCGDSLYRDEIRALIDRGDIEYHGLDPDLDALDRLRATGIAGTFHPEEIEAFDHEAGYFDYALVLRSVNHFRDMTRAFEVISKLLRVHGQMVLCDSPPFAMLRTPRQVTYADENAPVGHEHYRNWTSHQVIEFLKRFPFRVDVHRPVSAKTSNEWIVKVMRMPDGIAADPSPDPRRP